MKKRFLSLALLGLLTLTACGSSPKVGDAFAGEVNNYEGVTMTVVEGTATPGGEGCMTLPTCYYEKDIPQRLYFQWSTDYRFPFAFLYPGRYRLILDFYKQDGSYSYGPDFSLAAEFTVK